MSGVVTGVSVLALLPSQEDQSCLNEIFWHSRWNLHFAESLGHARALIDQLPAGVVISDCRLPDGTWKDVLRELRRRPNEAPLIVASRKADERLWAEVLNLGGYDILTTPFEAQEVVRSVSLAWRHWRDKLLTTAPPAARVMAAGLAGSRFVW